MKRIFIIFTVLIILSNAAALAEGKAEKSPAESRVYNGNYVQVPGGTFTMGGYFSGGDHGGEYGVEPRKDPWPEVTVSVFYMAMSSVTQKEYLELTGTNPSIDKGDNKPVEAVSWFEAIEYCNRLSQRDGLSPAYMVVGENVTWNRSANGYRLPTEAEWEYACRAPTVFWTQDGHPWGLDEMPGDYYEWCWDWYAEYPSGTFTDPDGAASGIHRVLRGGPYKACMLRGEHARMRSHDFSNISGGLRFGFRLVRSSI